MVLPFTFSRSGYSLAAMIGSFIIFKYSILVLHLMYFEKHPYNYNTHLGIDAIVFSNKYVPVVFYFVLTCSLSFFIMFCRFIL